jgi:hypothetical protein
MLSDAGDPAASSDVQLPSRPAQNKIKKGKPCLKTKAKTKRKRVRMKSQLPQVGAKTSQQPQVNRSTSLPQPTPQSTNPAAIGHFVERMIPS